MFTRAVNDSRALPFTEDEMTDECISWLNNINFYKQNGIFLDDIKPSIIKETPIKSISNNSKNTISKRSDLIIYFSDRKIINIESKLTDTGCVINQAKDHLKWADYSYILIPYNAYIGKQDYKTCFDLGIGIILFYFEKLSKEYYKFYKDQCLPIPKYHNPIFIESFRAKHNTYKNLKDKDIRKDALISIKKKLD